MRLIYNCSKRSYLASPYRSMRAPSLLLVALLPLGNAACVDGSSDDGLIADDGRDDMIGFGYCPPHLCGLNSDLAGSISFDAHGVVENAGKRLVAAYASDGREVSVRVKRADLELVPKEGEGEKVGGAELVGARFVFEDSEDGHLTTLYLDGYEKGKLVSFNKPSVTYPSYQFSYHEEGEPEGQRRPLCGDFPWAESFDVGELDTADALLVQSEALDSRGRPVEGVTDNFTWATLGCMGGAYAKKVLMGYDPHHPPPEDTSLAENETMLRMLTARYCPEGAFHTVPGTPIYWENDRGWYTLDTQIGTELEAIGSSTGAVCLNTPRVVERARVEDECGSIPRCDEYDPGEYHLSSYRVLD